METPFDPAILLLEIYPKNPETPVLKNLCIHVFITVLFTRDKIWKQFKCPSVNEWIQKKKPVVHLHNGILHTRKKEGILTFCDSMDGAGEYCAM